MLYILAVFSTVEVMRQSTVAAIELPFALPKHGRESLDHLVLRHIWHRITTWARRDGSFLLAFGLCDDRGYFGQGDGILGVD